MIETDKNTEDKEMTTAKVLADTLERMNRTAKTTEIREQLEKMIMRLCETFDDELERLHEEMLSVEFGLHDSPPRWKFTPIELPLSARAKRIHRTAARTHT